MPFLGSERVCISEHHRLCYRGGRAVLMQVDTDKRPSISEWHRLCHRAAGTRKERERRLHSKQEWWRQGTSYICKSYKITHDSSL